jgi:hypothetical protein
MGTGNDYEGNSQHGEEAANPKPGSHVGDS